MKLRNHISLVVCLVVALASHYLGSAAFAQQAVPCTPFMPCARQPCFSDRIYIQGGVQFRAIQRLGFQKKPSVIRYAEPVQDPHNPGVFYPEGFPPFGPNKAGDFGTGTGVPGYQEFGPPNGNSNDDPRRSGIWRYDDGYITPNGNYTLNDVFSTDRWPFWPGTDQERAGLGQYITTNDGVDLGVFTLKNTATQVLSGLPGIYPNAPQNSGFEPKDPPLKTSTFAIQWSRMIDDTVGIEPELGVPSRIWHTWGGEIQTLDYNEQIWCPTVEIGVQATSFVDVFWGLTWFGLEKAMSRTFTTRAELWRRAFKDTFSFWSDDTNNWQVGSWESDVRPNGTNVSQQIVPDGRGTGGFPNRQFYEVLDGKGASNLPPVVVTETVVCRTDATVYENRFGLRSWTPLYGMGRFGVTLGPLVNFIYYRASQSAREAYSGGVTHVDDKETLSQGWLVSYGIFTAADVEIDWNNYFLKTNAQYSLSEEKQLHNSDYTWTNLNVSGFSSIFAAGVRF
jgi:hypothetical protein